MKTSNRVKKQSSLTNTLEYKNLVDENINLKSQIEELCGDGILLLDVIDQLKKSDSESKLSMEKLEKENSEIKHRLLKIENRCLFDKYVFAIQDINREEHLEIKLHSSDAQNLAKLRYDRVNDCHYLGAHESSKFYNDKLYVLLEKMKNMPVDILNIFNEKYPNLINKLIPIIPNICQIHTQDSINSIELYWEI